MSGPDPVRQGREKAPRRFGRASRLPGFDSRQRPLPLALVPEATPGALADAPELWLALHLPELAAAARDPRFGNALLEKLATYAVRFTPRVSLEPPDGLLLEVRGSLHLFGGVKPLARELAQGCAALGARAQPALAPTALAALAGARAGARFIVRHPAQLAGRLAELPLEVLRWPPQTLERLAKLGVRTIGAALRLPRAGFARRFGRAELEALDRLLGRRAEPRRAFLPRERFRVRFELAYEIDDTAALLAALAPRLRDLEQFLRARQHGLSSLACRFHHRGAVAVTGCALRFAQPAFEAARFTTLLREQLATLVLPAPVIACELRSGALVPYRFEADSLWRPGEHGGEAGRETPAFIERLRARLGDDAVHGLCLVPEHRPEQAWRVAESGAAGREEPPWSPFRRPLWLLREPQRLAVESGKPRLRGPLRIAEGPERIESGWWDGRDVARDYYVALDRRGARLWIYRERVSPHGWFLHGVFG